MAGLSRGIQILRSPCCRVVLLITALAACGDGNEEAATDVVATVEEGENSSVEAAVGGDSPEPAPLPEPLMRQALMCCADMAIEPVMEAYLALGRGLAKGDKEEQKSQARVMSKAIGRLQDAGAHLVVVDGHLKTILGAEVHAARAEYGVISDLLVGKLETSASGALDLAVAYSREADHHWLQEGVEPRSPYGDGIQSYSWGSREEVLAADAVREKELSNPEP
jgi:hypothetical protein